MGHYFDRNSLAAELVVQELTVIYVQIYVHGQEASMNQETDIPVRQKNQDGLLPVATSLRGLCSAGLAGEAP